MKRRIIAFAVFMQLLGLGITGSANAAQSWWGLTTSARPSELTRGSQATLGFRAANLGNIPTEGDVTLKVSMPTGLKVLTVPETTEIDVDLLKFPENNLGTSFCSEPSPHQLECTYHSFSGPLNPYEFVEVSVLVEVESGAVATPSTFEVTGGDALPARTTRTFPIRDATPEFGTESFSITPEEEGGSIDTQAGSHPYQLTTTFGLNQTSDQVNPPALARNLKFELPPGLVANVVSAPQCTEADFETKAPSGFADRCPEDSAVGVAMLTVREPVFSENPTTYPVPVFNLAPEAGEPARFGIFFIGIEVTVDFSLRTGGDYGAVASVRNITQVANLISESVTIWGAPGEQSHDPSRGWGCLAGRFYEIQTLRCLETAPTHPPAFLTLPTSCKTPFDASVEGEAWPTKADPGGAQLPRTDYSLVDSLGRSLSITGCNRLSLEPSVTMTPGVTDASTATGFDFDIHVPQQQAESATGLAPSAIKDLAVTLPRGVKINDAGASGLEACSEGNVGFTAFGELNPGLEPGVATARFTSSLPDPFCPAAAKVANVTIKSPLLADPLNGAVYVSSQNANPFGSLLAVYLVAEDPKSGVLVKLAGEVHLGEEGQVTTVFKNNPELPFEDADVKFFEGSRATLSTPAKCGGYSAEASFVPWSGNPSVGAEGGFSVEHGVDGGPCPGVTLPLDASLSIGSSVLSAGSFTPLVTNIERADGRQNIQSIHLRLPEGLEGSLAHVALCAEALANEGACPSSSQIGETTVTAGIGSTPITIPGGHVYLTEKYAGAPFGLAVVTPAKAGPFDLEHDTSYPANQPTCDCFVVRARVEVDPLTAELAVTTDASGPHAIPHEIDGVPVEIRQIHVNVTREDFALNATSCDPLSGSGILDGDEGGVEPVSFRYQVANCERLKFTPKVVVTASGQASKRNGTDLRFKISYPQGSLTNQSWFSEAKFDIPKQLPARLETLQRSCLADVFEVDPAECPSAAKIGHATVHTPILPVPLEGPVYFVSYGGAKFPDAVMLLHGYGITIMLRGETFISHNTGVTSATFKGTPDVPFESIEVDIPSGRFSEFGANLPAKDHFNFCGHKLVMPTLLKAQNGREIHQNTAVNVAGCKKAKRKARKAGRHQMKK